MGNANKSEKCTEPEYQVQDLTVSPSAEDCIKKCYLKGYNQCQHAEWMESVDPQQNESKCNLTIRWYGDADKTAINYTTPAKLDKAYTYYSIEMSPDNIPVTTTTTTTTKKTCCCKTL